MASWEDDLPFRPSGAISRAIRNDDRVQALAKAADRSPDSKGPAGIGKFGDYSPQNFTEFANAANPYGTAQTFDGGAVRGNLGAPAQPKGSMNNALRQAMGFAPRQRQLPQILGNLFKEFERAEGREPTDSDSEFFKAVVVAFDAHGEQVDDEIRKAAERAPARADDDLVERFSKAIGDDTPTWVKEIVRRHAED